MSIWCRWLGAVVGAGGAVLEFPARYLVRFMANHQMLQLRGRPAWRVVRGGSASYVRALRRAGVCRSA